MKPKSAKPTRSDVARNGRNGVSTPHGAARSANSSAYPSAKEIDRMVDLVTVDDTPVDNLFAERQMRLLVEPLYTSPEWLPADRTVFATSNVGVFYNINVPPIVPDAFLVFDVEVPMDTGKKSTQSYFVWLTGKPPDVAVEIVSRRNGGEGGRKLKIYAEIGVPYYIIHDPDDRLHGGVLRIYRLNEKRRYELIDGTVLPEFGLSLTLWEGRYQGWPPHHSETWLRWCDRDGRLLLSGPERVEFERKKAELAMRRSQQLMERLRSLGIDPDTIPE